MKTYIVIHSHKYGESHAIVQSATNLNELTEEQTKEVAGKVGFDYEPERDEEIVIIEEAITVINLL